MSILFLITTALAAVWLIAIFITRYLMKQAQESAVQKLNLDRPEHKYT